MEREERETIAKILARPGAKELWTKLQAEAWLAPFLVVEGDRALRRLGFTMAVVELCERIEPGRKIEETVYMRIQREWEERKARGEKVADEPPEYCGRGRPPNGFVRPTGKKDRGTCCSCEVDVSLNKNGTARKHYAGGQVCFGSLKPPSEKGA